MKRHMSLVATGLLVIGVAASPLSRGFYDQTDKDVFFSLTLASTAIVFLHVRPLREGLQLLAAACLLVLLQALALKVPLKATPVLALLGVSSLGLLACARSGLAIENAKYCSTRSCRRYCLSFWDMRVRHFLKLPEDCTPQHSICFYPTSMPVLEYNPVLR